MKQTREKRLYERHQVTIVELRQQQLLQTSANMNITLEEEDWDYGI